MAWDVEMVRMVRHMVNDLTTTKTYTDARLKECIIVSAQLTVDDIQFEQAYTINLDLLQITPDPTLGNKDDSFINLVCLKTACMLDTGETRDAVKNALRVSDARSSIDGTGKGRQYLEMLKTGWCPIYQEAKFSYELGRLAPGHAILGPFAGDIHGYNESHRDRSTF